MRLLLVIMLVVAFGQAAGVPLLGADACDDIDCSDGKLCPPQCPTCTCATTHAPSLPAVAIAVAPLPQISSRVVVFPPARQFAASPDPAEILRVPRRA